MAVYGVPKKSDPPKADLIPIGAHVDVISGSYPGHWAVIVGHTAKKYHVRLDTGYVTALKKSSVKLSSKQPNTTAPREPKSPAYKALIQVELNKIQASLDEIYVLMNNIKIEEDQSKVSG